ncbi:hypothetical protein PBI_ANDREW_67 [Arthrobacter phage Andrew]|uniref:Uncharacterized protein n=1 Tax=Arthrobacter phage Andrew TaxID=2419946 RepID=A0A3G2KD21_9CAUD|nr:hypothetical protein HOU53_gp67 [Arthrobacter phage Andrew]AYN56879.1 hypothetical protein PBI_ANDREW_67 [Arthrobacter phage Andrew]
MTAEEERQLVEDKTVPPVEWRVPEGYVLLELGGQWSGPRLPVRRIMCATDGHDDRPAVVTGRFRAPWWPEDREEHAAYCQMCARLAVFMSMFTPDFDGWQP